MALGLYRTLYGTKGNPLDTHADRMHTIGFGVKIVIYTCIAAVVFLSLNFALVLLDLQRWEPFALSAFFVTCALFYFIGVNAPPRRPEMLDREAHAMMEPRVP